MRFSIAAIFGLAAIATAQTITSNGTAVVTSQASTAASPAPTSKSPQEICLAACSATDICCQAKCVNVPCPNGSQVNATTECAAKCVQGSGSKSDTDKYAACQQSCISSLFFPLSATATGGASGSRSAGSAGATTTGAGALASGTGSASGTGASASATHNAAAEVRFGAAGMGLVGLIVAGLAL